MEYKEIFEKLVLFLSTSYRVLFSIYFGTFEKLRKIPSSNFEKSDEKVIFILNIITSTFL